MSTRSDTDQSTPYTPESGAPAPDTASLVEDFIDVFYAPSAVYARRRNSSFWPYFWIVSVVAAGFMFASRSVMSAVFDVEWSRQARLQMEKNPQITEEMMQQSRGMMEGFSNFGVYLATPFLILFGALLIFLGARIVSAKVAFGRAMLISAIAQIPRLLGALLTTVQGLLMDDTSGIRSKFDVGYSPARFMEPDAMPAQVMEVIGRLDVFTIWVTVLMGLGVAVIARVPRGKGLAAGAVAWGIASLLTLVSLLWS